jgi:Ca2+-binding EF-hand superfamily protein
VVSGIDREWFCKIISAKMIDFQSEKELSDAFNILDEDGSGEIDATEFAYVMRHLGQGYTDK